MPLTAGDFSSVETAADFHLDSLRAKPQRLFNCFAHGPAKSNALLELGRNLFRLQLSVQFRLMNFLNRNQNFTAGLGRKIALQLVDLSALASDDDSRTRSVDDDLEPVRRALNVNV